jgi:membrane protein
MTKTAHEMHEADTGVAAAELKTNEQIDVLKSKASDLLSSPYVRGAAVLGVAAAGYALVRRKKPVYLIRRQNALETLAIS